MAHPGTLAKTVDQLRPHIEAIAHRLLDGMEAEGGTELLASYCYELPVIVICELLGVPAEDHARFGRWVPDVVAGQPSGWCSRLRCGSASVNAT